LFIIHTLTISGEADRKLIASYPTHFRCRLEATAWQFVLAVGFVSLLWGVLFLGAETVSVLIRIEFLAELIKPDNIFRSR